MSDVKVYQRQATTNGRLITLRISGAPKLRFGDRKMPTHVLPEILEITIDANGIDMVIVTGPGLRRDGSWGIVREMRWWWRENRDEIPAWIQELVLADPAAIARKGMAQDEEAGHG